MAPEKPKQNQRVIIVILVALALPAFALPLWAVFGSEDEPAISGTPTGTTGPAKTGDPAPKVEKPELPPANNTGGSGATLAIERPVHPTSENIKPRDTSHYLDYVCKKQVNEAKSLKVIHEGGTYHFCCEECQKKFQADPYAYLSGSGVPGSGVPGGG